MKSQTLNDSRRALFLMMLLGVSFFLFIPGSSTVSLVQAAELSAFLVLDRYEPDNIAAQAKPIFPAISQTHNIVPSNDVDWVWFQLTTPAFVALETTGPDGYDTRLWLYHSNLAQISFSDDEGEGLYSRINTCNMDILPAGTYFVKVDDFNNDNEIPYYNLSLFTGDNCVLVDVAGTTFRANPLFPGVSTRQSYAGVNNGPVYISVFNGDLGVAPIVASERVIYKFNGVPTSFSEMMALPDPQLDHTVWLPWYNNVDLNTQLRITSFQFDRVPVSVDIGGIPVPGSPFILASQETVRLSFPDVNSGPVKIQSSGNIMASERVIYKINGVPTSFSEMMAMPQSYGSSTYWLPWYNNVDLDTQLRIANIGIDRALVSVRIGGISMGSSFLLGSEESVRLSFPGVNDGPVEISGLGDIVASERVIYKINGVPISFSEMMALPQSQLSSMYSLPWYNNVDLDTQLRFGNVSGSTATVHVYIGGTEMLGSPFTLSASGAGQSLRVSFPGINNGPVKIQSNVNIVAAERIIYKVNGIPTSFSEMMALSSSQLNIQHWLPWYDNNNLDMDTQLRFGVP